MNLGVAKEDNALLQVERALDEFVRKGGSLDGATLYLNGKQYNWVFDRTEFVKVGEYR